MSMDYAAIEAARVFKTQAQTDALRALCERYHCDYVPSEFRPVFGLPAGYVAGWAGPIYVGCDPEGRISS